MQKNTETHKGRTLNGVCQRGLQAKRASAIYPDLSKILTATEPTLVIKLSKSITEFRKQLHLCDEDEWCGWLRGPGFKPFGTAVYNDYIKDRKGGRAFREVGLDEVLETMRTFEGLSIPLPIHWIGMRAGAFHVPCCKYNIRHPDRFFKN
jgi:hypothetical protein